MSTGSAVLLAVAGYLACGLALSGAVLGVARLVANDARQPWAAGALRDASGVVLVFTLLWPLVIMMAVPAWVRSVAKRKR